MTTTVGTDTDSGTDSEAETGPDPSATSIADTGDPTDTASETGATGDSSTGEPGTTGPGTTGVETTDAETTNAETTAAETTAVLRAVGDALQYLHAKNLVHGNLRPENVLVTFGYEVKLLDVVPNGWLVNPNDALGVPARAPDKRDDVFGLACLAYEMLSGRHPYNGNTAQEAYRSGLEPERLENVTDRQWRAFTGALAVHRDDRTPNVQQFLDDLGVRASQKLKSVVATPRAPVPVADEPIPPPTYTAPEPPPAFPRPVYAERASRDAPERRGVFGKQGRQLGGQPRRPRAQLDKPGSSFVVCELERLIE
jgi:hypothetical protein